MKPKVAILVPVYNTQGSYLKECLDSCLQQTYQDLSIIVVDNGSDKLDTIKTLEEYNKFNNIIILKCDRKHNARNHSVCRNYGLDYIIANSYDYIVHIDSDDIMDKNRVKLQIEYMIENEEIDIAGSQMNYINKNLRIINNMPLMPANPTKEMINSGILHFLYHPSVIFRVSSLIGKEFYKENFFNEISFPEDLEFWLRCLYVYDFKIFNMDKTLTYYRIHEKSTCSTEGKENLWEINEKKVRDFYKNRN